MKLSDVKRALEGLGVVKFKLPDGRYVARHFHVTEVGLVTKHFIDCGGVERKESLVNFQLWQAGDYDHRLAPKRFLQILKFSEKVLGEAEDMEIEVEYQQSTIGRFGLEFDGENFILVAKQTTCLAQDACGVSPAQLAAKINFRCLPGGTCC